MIWKTYNNHTENQHLCMLDGRRESVLAEGAYWGKHGAWTQFHVSHCWTHSCNQPGPWTNSNKEVTRFVAHLISLTVMPVRKY